MKHWLRACCGLLIVGIVLLSGVSVTARVYSGQGPTQPRMIPGRVSVQFEDDVDVSRLAKGFGRVAYGVPSLDRILENVQVSEARPIFINAQRPAVNSGLKDLTRFHELTFPDSLDIQSVINQLMQNPHVRVAEPVWAYPVAAEPQANPNDPQWTSQWHMKSTVAQVSLAWGQDTGSDSVKVAIIDTGVLYKHSDLNGNIWVNPGEDLDHDGVVMDPDDLNGIDDDGNGIVDDLIGYDFYSGIGSCYPGEDCTTRDPDPADFNGHGTHCSGIVAAMTNNNLNVTGIAGGWFGGSRSFGGVRIMCCRAGGTGSDGKGYINSDDAAAAANYAVQMGASVINSSFGGGGYSSALAAAIDNAIAHGVSYVHAAGNDAVSTPGWEDNRFGVTSVAATDASDRLASFSNYGSWIDICAPGVSILSTYSNMYTPTTAILDGTSMAAPFICGVNALIRSMMPSLTRAQVDSVLFINADNIDGTNPSHVGDLGNGRVNAYKSLLNLANAKFTADTTSGNVPFTVQFADQSPNAPTTWNWSFGDGGASTSQNPSHTYTAPGPNGVYTVDLKITEPHGNGEEPLRNYLWVRADTCKGDSVMVDRGNKVIVPIRLHNTSPIREMQFAFTIANTANITLDTFFITGTRVASFYNVQYTAFAPSIKSYAIYMKAYNLGVDTKVLPADTGIILNLRFNVPITAPKNTVVLIDTLTVGVKNPYMTSIWGNYWPIWIPGKIVVRGCSRGDVNCDGTIDVSDLSMLVDFLFFGGTRPDQTGGDVNGDGTIDIGDLSFLVDYLFNGGPHP
ncbi:MAG TPA: S8 family serine peptidase [Candidatus Acidoferrum sp.]|nr:S8 family serine peptidase [Candidatus Acidoferrum sp.]